MTSTIDTPSLPEFNNRENVNNRGSSGLQGCSEKRGEMDVHADPKLPAGVEAHNSKQTKSSCHPGRPSKPDSSVELPQCRWSGCSQVFATAHGAREHEFTHAALPDPAEAASFICRIMDCKKKFPDSKQLRKHMALHLPKAFECETCGKKFHEATKLRRHLVVHSGDKNFICEECGKNFSFKANLKTHMRVHTGERPFTCTVPGCKRRFAQASNRNAHALTHYKDGELLPLDDVSPSSSPDHEGQSSSFSPIENEVPTLDSTGTQLKHVAKEKASTKRKPVERKSNPAKVKGIKDIPPPPPVPTSLPPVLSAEPIRARSVGPLLPFSSPIPKGAEELFLLATPRLSPEPQGLKRPLESTDDSGGDRRKMTMMGSYPSFLMPVDGPNFDRSSRAFQLYQGSSTNIMSQSAFRSTSPFMVSHPSSVLPPGTGSAPHSQGSPRLQFGSIPPTAGSAVMSSSVQSTPILPMRTTSLGSQSTGGSIPQIGSVGSAPNSGSQNSATDFDKSALFRLAQMSTDMLDRSVHSSQASKVMMSMTPPPFPAMPGMGNSSIFAVPGSANSSSSSDKSLLFSSSFSSLNSDDSRLLTPQLGMRLSPDAFSNLI